MSGSAATSVWVQQWVREESQYTVRGSTRGKEGTASRKPSTSFEWKSGLSALASAASTATCEESAGAGDAASTKASKVPIMGADSRRPGAAASAFTTGAARAALSAALLESGA